eukprot:2249410-Rhodomonas_salina.1
MCIRDRLYVWYCSAGAGMHSVLGADVERVRVWYCSAGAGVHGVLAAARRDRVPESAHYQRAGGQSPHL